MKNKWRKVWDSLWDHLWDRLEAQERLSRRGKKTREGTFVLQIQEDDLKKLQKIAQTKNLNVYEAIQESIDLYCEYHLGQGQPKISEERKERNPLLRLEGLCSISFRTNGSRFEGQA